MRGGRVAIAVVLVLLLGLLSAGRVLACSCAPTPPKEALARADAAIVGRLLAVEARGLARAAYRYRVVRVYRGEIQRGSVATVLSGRSSAACALPTRVGRNYGLFLLGQGGRWASGLCGIISPRRLWAAARASRRPASEAEASGSGCAS